MPSTQAIVVTYNCGREPVKPVVFSSHLAKALPNASPEILVFALQELAPIAYSFLGGTFLKPYLGCIRATVDLAAQKWGGGPYELLLSRHVGMTALAVFVRDDVKDRVAGVEAGGVGVGWYEMGNKGAVAINLKLEGIGHEGGDPMEATFVAAHLAPMEWNLQRRNEDWENIVRGLVLKPVDDEGLAKRSRKSSSGNGEEQEPLLNDEPIQSSQEGPSTSDSRGLYSPGRHLIVAGDLNYRTSSMAPRPSSRAMFPRLSLTEESPQHYKNLFPNDQLSQEIKASRALHGFVEAPIAFAPTYKYSNSAQKAMALLEEDDLRPGSRRDEAFDADDASKSPPLDWPWSSHRWPSWCDRVLYLSCDGEEFKSLKYTSLPLMSTSDHQPVVLQFEIPWTRPQSDVRRNPPFPIDPDWQSRRVAARRLEVLTGLAAYLGTTWEGTAILTAVVVGSIGGWVAIQSML